MTRLRGSDADRRAWYEAHWRLRVDQPVVCAPEVTEETLQAWADYLGGWVYFDRDAWMAAMRAAAGPNDEGPPTPTAMPRTVGWCAEQRLVMVCPHGRRWGLLCPHCMKETP